MCWSISKSDVNDQINKDWFIFSAVIESLNSKKISYLHGEDSMVSLFFTEDVQKVFFGIAINTGFEKNFTSGLVWIKSSKLRIDQWRFSDTVESEEWRK